MYIIGLDIGYSSAKMVLIDEHARISYSNYRLHKGDAAGVIRQFLDEASKSYPLSQIGYGAITGTCARILGKSKEINIVNEVAALVEGALASRTGARSIIEIGGQSAKYITGLNSDDRSRIKIAMNSNCSSGTGSFLEEQVSRLNLRLEDYSRYAARARTIPRIAGRCSVFAKTDITHHQQEGVPVEDILLGLAYSVVRNYRVSVMRKLSMEKPILLAGGVAHNNGIRAALRDVLDLDNGKLIIPEHMDCIAALGAAMIARNDMLHIDLEQLGSRLNRSKGTIDITEDGTTLPPLSLFGSNDSSGRHRIVDTQTRSLDCYLGVDVGSTSTNLVASDRQDRIIGFRYLRTHGNPLEAVRSGLKSLEDQFKGKLKVLGACTTGSGRYMTARLIGADLIKDEITAQARAAVTIDPDVDTIFEIGGQDSKYISIKDRVVTDFQMNKICAAGTGSFIEEQAKKFNIPLNEIGRKALVGFHPVNLGERCTVFIESSIAAHLASGAKMEDITAGLCYSIVKNYLNRVVGQKKVGEKVLFQGGVAYNQGVVNAFRCLTGKEILVPPFFSVTGAYGAAILARESMKESETTFKGFHLESNEIFLQNDKRRKAKKKRVSRFNRSVE